VSRGDLRSRVQLVVFSRSITARARRSMTRIEGCLRPRRIFRKVLSPI